MIHLNSRVAILVSFCFVTHFLGVLSAEEVRYNRRSYRKQVTYDPVVREPTELELYPQGELELHLRESHPAIPAG